MARIDNGPNAYPLTSAKLPRINEHHPIAHPLLTWHQNTMCNLPVVFPRVSCEEPVLDSVSDLGQTASDEFRESLLIADLIHQGLSGDEDLLLTTQGKLEDWSFTPSCQNALLSEHLFEITKTHHMYL